jgi:hypothetical protein
MTTRDLSTTAELDELTLETLGDLDVTADDVVRGGAGAQTGKACEYVSRANEPGS